MKWLTTGTMIDRLKVGEEAISNCGEMKAIHEGGSIRFIQENSGSSYAYFHAGIINAKWRILPKYVSFDEAMKALKEGKVAVCHTPDGYRFNLKKHWKFDDLEEFYDYSFEDLFNFKWIIEDDIE